MKALLARLAPAEERRTALWLAFGGSLLTVMSTVLGSAVLSQMPAGTSQVPGGGAYTVQALSEFALVTLLVATAIRFLRAPKALAFYLLLSQLLAAASAVLSLPADILSAARAEIDSVAVAGTVSPVFSTLSTVLVALGVGLGAVAGAWAASTVSMARIQDEGFSGDEPDGVGLSRHPRPRTPAFMGWTGRPVRGDALIATALVSVAVLPSVMTAVIGVLEPLLGGFSSNVLQVVVWTVLVGAAWFFSAWFVTRRLGVASTWMRSLGGLLGTLVYLVYYAISAGSAGILWGTGMLTTLVPAAILLIATVAGSWLALRGRPATLSAPDRRDGRRAKTTRKRRSGGRHG